MFILELKSKEDLVNILTGLQNEIASLAESKKQEQATENNNTQTKTSDEEKNNESTDNEPSDEELDELQKLLS